MIKLGKPAGAEVKNAIKEALALPASSEIKNLKIFADQDSYSVQIKISPDKKIIPSISRNVTINVKSDQDKDIPNLIQELQYGPIGSKSRTTKKIFKAKRGKRVYCSLPGNVTDHDPEDRKRK